MDIIESSEQTAKNLNLIDATEKIETVMGFYPQFQPYEPQIHTSEISPQTGIFMLLWFFVLLAQFLMFWQQKNIVRN